MKKPPPVEEELSIRDLNHHGQGVGVGQGGVVTFVEGALPGERVAARVTVNKKNYRAARLISVAQPSPQRVTPFCPHAQACGGCPLQAFSHAGQLAWKKDFLVQSLRRLGGVAVGEVAVLVGQDREYRATLRLVGQVQDGQWRLGFFAPRSHQLAAIGDCPVSAPPVRRVLGWLLQQASQHPRFFAGVASVGLRASGAGEVQVLLGMTQPMPPGGLPFVPDPPVQGVAVCQKPPGNQLFQGPWRVVWGQPKLTDDRLGFLGLQLGPGAFVQAHPAVHDAFLRELETFARAQPPGPVADLFAGTGLSSLVLARAGHRVASVEAGQAAHADAVANLRRHAPGAQAVRAVAEDWLAAQAPGEFEGIFLNPPRRGLLPGGAAALAALGPRWVVYQSCNPASLARDAAVLSQAGYVVARAWLLDFFPHTAHLEAALVMTVNRGKKLTKAG